MPPKPLAAGALKSRAAMEKTSLSDYLLSFRCNSNGTLRIWIILGMF
jgi:hypothetical protein